MSRKYGLKGVPSLVVDGKYLISGRMGGTPQETIKTLGKEDETIIIFFADHGTGMGERFGERSY